MSSSSHETRNHETSWQAGALADVDTLQAYTEWMKGLFTPVPDGRYEGRSFAVDEARQNVAGYGMRRCSSVAWAP